MARRPTLAFAGAGMISVVHGMSAAMAGLDVVAVASRSEVRAHERAEQLRARAVRYPDLPAGADAVVVATPPAQHAALTVAALGRGAAVLVEKPLATTLAGADAIVTASASTGRPVVYAENLLFSPVVREAAALTHDLGPLQHLSLRTLQPRPEWGSFLDPSWGGGVLFDLGVHPIAMALLLAAEPVASVTARLDCSAGVEVDDHASVTLRFTSGLCAQIECSWRHPVTEWDFQAASATGVVRAELQPTAVLEHDGEPVALPRTAANADPRLEQLGYVGQLAGLASALRGSPPACDAELGRDVLDLVMAGYASAGLDGAEIPVPFAGDRSLTPLEHWGRGAS
jgi:predicted dehydrogenase